MRMRKWIKDRFHGWLDNFLYDWGCRLVVWGWPFLLSFLYWVSARFGKIEWRWWVNAVLLLIGSILALVAIFRTRPRTKKDTQREVSSTDHPDQKLLIACGPDIEGSVCQAWWTLNAESMPVNFFRIVVNATEESQLVKNCTGFLTRIEKDGKT